jgi:pantoate--beta-alanine ligase
MRQTTIQIARTIAETRAALRQFRTTGKTIGLVPTMGALHEGHLSLVRAARSVCDVVVVSIFVNSRQFGPNEDFAKYPRTFDADCLALEGEAVDLIFAPSAQEMYPDGSSTPDSAFVDVDGIGGRLDGGSRPGHFRGVATVVAKLFHIIGPNHAFFGQKDAAQVAILRKMVRDLNFPLELTVCPIVRDPDGLAMSSRNQYLSSAERVQALVLHRALQEIERLAKSGITAADDLISAAHAVLGTEPHVRVDYCRIVNPDSLEDVSDVQDGALAAVAAFVGATRLIDNVVLVTRYGRP